MVKYHEFDCGCKFPVLNDKKFANDGLPSIDIDFYNLPLCTKAWELMVSGNVTGCFQLESQLGKSWDKKLKPVCIEDVSALVALIRPSCINAIVDGKSMAERYIDRRNGEEEYENFSPEADEILNETFGTILYQEQAILIARKFAGFDLKEADNLRKAMGKKDATLMQKTREKFLIGCASTNIIDNETANKVFDVIQASSRYSFNKCLSLDTFVIDDKNNKIKLRDISTGSLIECPVYDGCKIVNKLCKVVDIIENGKQHIFEIGFNNDKNKIKCTIFHKLLCKDLIARQLYEILYNSGRNIDRTNLDDLLINREDISNVLLEKNRTSRISSIKYIGIEDTVDIEIDNDLHCFYANGIATSNSHSVSYGIHTYITAYIKSHFPLHFYTAWLASCENKINSEDSLTELISDSKSHKITIQPPSILKSCEKFSIDDLTIRFGIGNIRSIGDSAATKIFSTVKLAEEKLGKKISEFSWFECIFYVLLNLGKAIAINMIASGCFSFFEMSRQLQMFEFSRCADLTKKEIEKILASNLKSVAEAYEFIAKNVNAGRREKVESYLTSLKNPPSSLNDNEEWISNTEQHILGYSVTCSRLDSVNSTPSNTTCEKFNNISEFKNAVICCQVDRVSEYRPKQGKMLGSVMAYLTVSDKTGSCECVLFPEQYKSYANLLTKGNTITIYGSKSVKGSFSVRKVEQL